MADFASTKHNSTFEEWHEQLQDYADLRGDSVADAEAWREDYDNGKSVADAYHDEYGDD